MTSKEKIFNALNHREGPVPWLEICVDGKKIMSSVLGYKFSSWEDQVKFAQRVGLDAITFEQFDWYDIGFRVTESDKMLGIEPLLKDWESLEKTGFLQVKIDKNSIDHKIKSASRAIGESGLALGVVFGFGIETTINSMGIENFSLKLYDDRDLVNTILEKLVEYSIELAQLFSSYSEIDFIWMADDLAFKTGPFMSPALFKEWIMPYFRKVVENIKKPWVFHSDGNLMLILEDLLSLGMKGLHPIEPGAMDIFQLKKEIGDRVCLMGNVSLDLLGMASPEEVKEEVKRLAEQCACGGGYILASANSIPGWVKPENVLAMGEAIRKFNREHYD